MFIRYNRIKYLCVLEHECIQPIIAYCGQISPIISIDEINLSDTKYFSGQTCTTWSDLISNFDCHSFFFQRRYQSNFLPKLAKEDVINESGWSIGECDVIMDLPVSKVARSLSLNLRYHSNHKIMFWKHRPSAISCKDLCTPIQTISVLFQSKQGCPCLY